MSTEIEKIASLEEALRRADYYIDRLEALENGKVVRDLCEAQSSYATQRALLAALPALRETNAMPGREDAMDWNGLVDQMLAVLSDEGSLGDAYRRGRVRGLLAQAFNHGARYVRPVPAPPQASGAETVTAPSSFTENRWRAHD